MMSLVVYNLLGQTVKTLFQGWATAGAYRTVWDGKGEHGQRVASGVYIYRLQAEGIARSRKMVLMK